VDSSLTFTSGGGSFVVDSLQVEGIFDSTAGVNVYGGDVIGNGTINHTAGTFLVDGTGDFGGATDWTFYNLDIGEWVGSGTITKIGSNDITITNDLAISGNQGLDLGGSGSVWTVTGTVANAGGLTGGGDLTINGGSFTGDGTVNLTDGTFLLDGTGNFAIPHRCVHPPGGRLAGIKSTGN